uniref:Uncharacterized protein n=1 Tax=Anguilla anguilla TaxID=7936 RepID=A0A0E9W3A0_ANGAN
MYLYGRYYEEEGMREVGTATEKAKWLRSHIRASLNNTAYWVK